MKLLIYFLFTSINFNPRVARFRVSVDYRCKTTDVKLNTNVDQFRRKSSMYRVYIHE